MIGRTISHYRILEKLGEGGMGVVYKAEDTKLERTVALKFLAPHALESPEHKARFAHEAKAAAALDHPNICTVYEIDEAEGQTFIAMAYIDGPSLKQKIEERPLKLDEALDIALQIGEGLQAAHEKEIVHRDVKSANVMLTRRGQVKIMDFGLAHLAGCTRITKTGSTLGTPAYMSPEQVRGEDTDRRTDIWSLGVVLYEMVSGQLPFKGEVAEAVSYGILNADPEPLTALRVGVPIKLDGIVTKALTKNPNERYQHVDEMLVDLRALRKQVESGQRAAPPSRVRPARKPRVLVYASLLLLGVLLIALGLYLRQPPIQEEASVAVLPLENLSGDPEQEYLSDGMTEELLTQLAGISSLRVISRTSVMRFKNSDQPLSEIARRLNVSHVVEGSVLRVGDRIRVTAQLIEAETDRHLWARSFDRDLQDVLALHSDVARAIAGEIRVELTPLETERLASTRPVNREAYEACLKGQFYMRKWTPDDITRGIEYLQQAIREDPEYAPAYARLSGAYTLAMYLSVTSGSEILPKAKAAAQEAVELDDTLADAHRQLGSAEAFAFNWLEAERELRRAVELDPGLSMVHHGYATACLAPQGRLEEALAEMERAVELDPLNVPHNIILAAVFFYMRDYDRAINHLLETLALDPDYPVAHAYLADFYIAKGMYEEAIAACHRARRAGDMARSHLAVAYAKTARQAEARQILEESLTDSEQRYVSPSWIARMYFALGDKARGFEWLEKAYQQRDMWVIHIKRQPFYDPVRSDPRFTALLKKMNLEP